MSSKVCLITDSNFKILYIFGLESAFNEKPCTIAPNSLRINVSQEPLKPVFPVIKTLYF